MRYEQIAVYIMATGFHGTIYVGVTSYLIRRIHEHRTHAVDGFTKRYRITQLVYFELHPNMESAIRREKRLKKYTREQKIRLIEKDNPTWNDCWELLLGSHE
jgi:putative endonuclease